MNLSFGTTMREPIRSDGKPSLRTSSYAPARDMPHPVLTASAAGHRSLCILICSNVFLSSQHVEMIELHFLFVEGILILK